MRAPCDGKYYVTLSFEGANATQTSDGWRFFHAPGTDEPLLAIQREWTGYVNHELYFVTDGAGRQLALGRADGSLHDSEMPDHELWTTRGIGWRRAGATQGGRGFGADRLAGPETKGLSYFRNRAYDARTGRWTQEDPIGVAGGLNLYQFNGNNPVAYTDPFGLCPIPPSDCPPRYFTATGAHLGAAIGASTGGTVGAVLGPAGELGLCAPGGPVAVACAVVGGTAGRTAGAAVGSAKGAAIGAAVGAVADWLVQLAKKADTEQGNQAAPVRAESR